MRKNTSCTTRNQNPNRVVLVPDGRNGDAANGNGGEHTGSTTANARKRLSHAPLRTVCRKTSCSSFKVWSGVAGVVDSKTLWGLQAGMAGSMAVYATSPTESRLARMSTDRSTARSRSCECLRGSNGALEWYTASSSTS